MGRMIGFVQSIAAPSNTDEQSLAFASDVTAGSLIVVNIFESTQPSVPVVTDTQGNTYALAGIQGGRTSMYYAVAGASGPCTVTVNGSTDTFVRFTMAEYSGDWGADPLDQTGTVESATSPLATASITPANAAALLVAVAGRATDTTWVAAGTDWTLGPVGSLRVVGAHRIVSSSAAYAASFSWTGGSGAVMTVIASFVESVAASGPTIDTQPVADTVLINGDAARSSASFTVAATGTGTLSYQWELETSVGGGTYANVADGDGATWAGATTTNLTATFTVKTLTGRRVRCVVTNDNGSTTSSAVALTVYTGPVISKTSGTTNASGVDTLTCVSDYPNADGEFTVVAATAGGVTKQVALHYETPA